MPTDQSASDALRRDRSPSGGPDAARVIPTDVTEQNARGLCSSTAAAAARGRSSSAALADQVSQSASCRAKRFLNPPRH